MAVSYTTNHNFPLLDDNARNWMAVINGVFEDLDSYLWQNRNILTHNGEVVVGTDGTVVLSEYPVQ